MTDEATLPAPLAGLTLPQLEAVHATILGGIAALERIERGGFTGNAALIVDEGEASLILTATRKMEDAQ